METPGPSHYLLCLGKEATGEREEKIDAELVSPMFAHNYSPSRAPGDKDTEIEPYEKRVPFVVYRKAPLQAGEPRGARCGAARIALRRRAPT